MRILLSNDDGIHATGLKVLEKIAHALSDDVWIVAPESDQSGVSHSFSLSQPLRLREIGPRHFAVTGTPTDSVIMAVRQILSDNKPDLVLSGVNRGQNVAEDVTYSGTVAAAMEGTLLGIASFALSLSYGGPDGRDKPFWETAERHAPAVIRRCLELGVPAGVLVNVNFPACVPDEVAGVEATSQGKRAAELMRIEQRRDGRGIPYYWLMFQRAGYVPPEGSDLQALARRKVSVTPLKLDLTDEIVKRRYAEAFAAA